MNLNINNKLFFQILLLSISIIFGLIGLFSYLEKYPNMFCAVCRYRDKCHEEMKKEDNQL